MDQQNQGETGEKGKLGEITRHSPLITKGQQGIPNNDEMPNSQGTKGNNTPMGKVRNCVARQDSGNEESAHTRKGCIHNALKIDQVAGEKPKRKLGESRTHNEGGGSANHNLTPSCFQKTTHPREKRRGKCQKTHW